MRSPSTFSFFWKIPLSNIFPTRKKDRKRGREGGKKEGRKEGKKERRKEGRKEETALQRQKLLMNVFIGCFLFRNV